MHLNYIERLAEMTFHKKKAKVSLSPVKVAAELKDSIIGVSVQKEKNYTDTMIYLLELGIAAHLSANVESQKAEAKPKKSPVKRFVAPTVHEIFDHMNLQCGDIAKATEEAEKFFNYWSDMDWKRKGQKMKDWKGSASNWIKNNYGSRSGSVDQSGFVNGGQPAIEGEVIQSQAGFLNHGQ